MSEDTTTTTEETSVQADIVPQPEIVETQAVQAEEETQAADTQTSSDDAELLEWANKKGVKTDDPIAILKMAREAEKKMHETQSSIEAKALKQAVTTKGESEGLDDTSLLLSRLTVSEFYADHPDAKALDVTMGEIVNSKPHLANDLETVYELAKARVQPKEAIAAKQAGQREALAQVAKAEKAAPPQASATTREGVTQISDEQIANMTTAEYLAFKKDTGFNPFKG